MIMDSSVNVDTHQMVINLISSNQFRDPDIKSSHDTFTYIIEAYYVLFYLNWIYDNIF